MSSWEDDAQDIPGTTPAVAASAAPADDSHWEDEATSAPDAPGNPYIDAFKHGASDARDFFTLNRGKGYHPADDPEIQDFKAKHQAGTATRQDYERMLMASFANTPPGKALGAIGGMVPEFNVIGTTLNHYVNPAAAKATGTNPEDWALGEMALPFAAKGVKSLRSKVDEPSITDDVPPDDGSGPSDGPGDDSGGPSLPSVALAGKVAKGVTYPVRHPLTTAATVLDAPASAARWATQPIVRGFLDGDNVLTKEPGLRSSMGTDTAVEGARLADKLGMTMSAGELTGSPFARSMEDTLANTGKWGPRFADAQKAKSDALVDNYSKILDQVADPTSPVELGGRVSNAYKQTLDSLAKTRAAQAGIDFGTAYKGSDDAGQYIQSNNLFKTLNELKDEGNARLLTDSKRLGGKISNQLLSKLAVDTKSGNTMADTITLKELGNGLSDFGQESANTDLPEASRRVYARLHGALQDDLNAEINNPKGDPERIAMLSKARDNYADYSNKISDLKKSTLGQVIGGSDVDSMGNMTMSPEVIANKFNTMQPSELKTTMKFLDEHHPDVADMGRRHILQTAIDKATDGQGQRGEGGSKPFDKAGFVKNLPSDEKLTAMFGDAKAGSDIKDVAAAANRIIDWGANKSGSQTFGRNNMFDSLMGFGKGLLIKSLVSDNIAEDLLDPMKRHSMAVEARKVQQMKDAPRGPGPKMGSGGDMSGSGVSPATFRANGIDDSTLPEVNLPKLKGGGRVKKNPSLMIAKTRLQMLASKA